MRSLERKYYKQANLPEPPYEQMPEFPPKPYPVRKSKRKPLRILGREEPNKDYIDKVNEANYRRLTAFGGNPNDKSMHNS